jgi:acetyl-CoA carboxylase biotin carboxyl carrier protein
MFTFEQIKEFVELVARHRLHGLEIERSGFHLRITGEAATLARELVSAAAVAAPPSSPSAAQAAVHSAPAGPAREAAPVPPVEALHVVTSPIVGTFYTAPSPDAPPFAKVGDRVRRGQILCIVEAMKLMNEIECDADGVVAEIYPKNAQPVEYGEALFGLRAG